MIMDAELDLSNCEYSKNVLKYLRHLDESKNVAFHKFSPQFKRRRHLIEWARVIGKDINLGKVTLHNAVRLLDYFMDGHSIGDAQLYLVTLVCLSLSSKYYEHESVQPKFSALNRYVSNKFLASDFLQVEMMIMSYFDWNVFMPTVVHYLQIFNSQSYLFASSSCRNSQQHSFLNSNSRVNSNLNNFSQQNLLFNERVENRYNALIRYFAAIAIEIEEFIDMRRDILAAAITYCSRMTLRVLPVWPKNLLDISGLTPPASDIMYNNVGSYHNNHEQSTSVIHLINKLLIDRGVVDDGDNTVPSSSSDAHCKSKDQSSTRRKTSNISTDQHSSQHTQHGQAINDDAIFAQAIVKLMKIYTNDSLPSITSHHDPSTYMTNNVGGGGVIIPPYPSSCGMTSFCVAKSQSVGHHHCRSAAAGQNGVNVSAIPAHAILVSHHGTGGLNGSTNNGSTSCWNKGAGSGSVMLPFSEIIWEQQKQIAIVQPTTVILNGGAATNTNVEKSGGGSWKCFNSAALGQNVSDRADASTSAICSSNCMTSVISQKCCNLYQVHDVKGSVGVGCNRKGRLKDVTNNNYDLVVNKIVTQGRNTTALTTTASNNSNNSTITTSSAVSRNTAGALSTATSSMLTRLQAHRILEQEQTLGNSSSLEKYRKCQTNQTCEMIPSNKVSLGKCHAMQTRSSCAAAASVRLPNSSNCGKAVIFNCNNKSVGALSNTAAVSGRKRRLVMVNE